MGGKKPLRRPLWPPTRATASNYYPLGLDGAGGAAKPLLRAPKKPAPLHGRLPAFSGAVDAFERARKCFLEWRYFFSIILSEFLKNRVALHALSSPTSSMTIILRSPDMLCFNVSSCSRKLLDTNKTFASVASTSSIMLSAHILQLIGVKTAPMREQAVNISKYISLLYAM